jgi:hypothetical protein
VAADRADIWLGGVLRCRTAVVPQHIHSSYLFEFRRNVMSKSKDAKKDTKKKPAKTAKEKKKEKLEKKKAR